MPRVDVQAALEGQFRDAPNYSRLTIGQCAVQTRAAIQALCVSLDWARAGDAPKAAHYAEDALRLLEGSPERVAANTTQTEGVKAGHTAGETTPGPWTLGNTQRHISVPNDWTIRQHEFPDFPYEGTLNDEWGVYPPLGHSGPVALVAGADNARLIAAAPDLLEALRGMVSAFGDITITVDGVVQPETDPEIIAARAAIAKALGQ